MATVHDVAAYILTRVRAITAMKLERPAYYAQAWSRVWDKAPLFPERVEAWANGPMIPALFARHRGRLMVRRWDGNPAALSRAQRATVDAVLRFYGKRTVQGLKDLTQRERPWVHARPGLSAAERGARTITPAAMVSYYSSL